MEGGIQAQITDNGIGFLTSQRKDRTGSSFHQSVGITLTQRRLALLDQSQTDDSVQIRELKDENGEVAGTQVTVRISEVPETQEAP